MQEPVHSRTGARNPEKNGKTPGMVVPKRCKHTQMPFLLFSFFGTIVFYIKNQRDPEESGIFSDSSSTWSLVLGIPPAPGPVTPWPCLDGKWFTAAKQGVRTCQPWFNTHKNHNIQLEYTIQYCINNKIILIYNSLNSSIFFAKINISH